MKQQISSRLLEFESLTTDLLSATDKAQVLSDLSNVQTLQEAKKLATKENYACRDIDHMGRVKVIMYRGVEIMLMYRRMTSSVPLSESHGTPSFALNNKDDVWVLFNIADLKASTALKSMFQNIQSLKNKITELETLDKAQAMLADAQTEAIERLEALANQRRAEHEAEIEEYKKKLAALTAKLKATRYNSSTTKAPVKKAAKATPKKATKKPAKKKSRPLCY